MVKTHWNHIYTTRMGNRCNHQEHLALKYLLSFCAALAE